MSRDGYESWDSPTRSRDSDSSPRSHRRRGSGQGDDRRPADERDDSAYQYDSEAYADQRGYGSRRPAGPDEYGTDGYGGDYRGGADPAAGYGDGYQGGYGQDRYNDGGYAGQGYEGGGYADGYGGRYADDGHGGGYGGDQRDPYAARDPYVSEDQYGTGDYGSADPYGRSDSHPSGPHRQTDPHANIDPYQRGRDPYDTGGYQGSDGYGGAPGYAGRDGYAGQDDYAGHDSYASPAGRGYEHEGYDQQDDDLYRWRDSQDAQDDPGATRRRRGRREDEFDAEDPRHDGFFRGFGGGDDDQGSRGKGKGGGRPPKQRKSHAGLIALGVVLAVFAGIAFTGYHYYSKYKALHASYQGAGSGQVSITVKPGDTLDGIGPQLLAKHVILAIDPWASYVANKSGLQPGNYKIHIHMSPAAAYAALMNPKNVAITKVTIPDGMRQTDILPLLAKDSGIPLSQFQTAIKDTAALGLPSYAGGNPEGYLYPDTYDLAPGETALKLLQTMVAQFNTEVTQANLVTAANTAQFTPAQVITGASLLEAEAGSRYWADVARVIDNRLNQGMPLGMDSTIAYGLGVHTDKLTTSQLNQPGPWNTRLNKGLPPGPIDSPDIAAIEAFLHPAPHTNTWLYFVTVDKSGTTNFTSSYSQFQAWQALAQKNGVV